MIDRDQQKRLREAYEYFVRRAQEEDPEAKEKVDALMRQAYGQARPRSAPLAAPPFAHTQTVDAELADVPELFDAWGALHEELPETMPPAYNVADSPAVDAFRRRMPTPEPEVIEVLNDGGLLGSGRYQILDPNWIEGTICWLRHLFDRVELNDRGPVISIPNTTSMALVGDWGTGLYSEGCPAAKVRRVMQRLQADYTVHLGDVYYAGAEDEVRDKFLAHWPVGSKGSFALNSNHEMYAGGRGLFGVTLKQDAFSSQQEASYFALQNDHWVIVGLDTAYHANRYRLYRKGKLNAGQLDFLAQQRDGLAGRRLMLMSHHQGLELDGEPSKKLWKQVQGVLAGQPATWYWGHLHSAVVYEDVQGVGGRCCGHGAMPRGRAAVLDDNERVRWFEDRAAGDPEVPPRVVNGLAFLQFDGAELRETYLDEEGRLLWRSWDGSPADGSPELLHGISGRLPTADGTPPDGSPPDGSPPDGTPPDGKPRTAVTVGDLDDG